MELLAMLRPLELRVDAPPWTPMGALEHWLASLSLKLGRGWLTSATGMQIYVGPTEEAQSTWKHNLRNFLRVALWWHAGKHRRDHSGAEDLDITAMLASVRAQPPQRQKVLVKILSGGMIVGERMHRWQQRQRDPRPEDLVDGICSHCGLGVLETERHVYWECTAWARYRRLALPDSAP
eukprot:6466479-Amphidinium_carterae.2